MEELTNQNRVIFVVGPTATGKSDLAVSLAEHYKAEIINADSIQFYNQIEVGTAKPSSELLARAKHHLLSFVDPPQTLSAGDFTRSAERVLVERTRQNIKNFILVGGSGFYIQALEKGMIPAPQVSDEMRERIKLKFEAEGPEKLWNEIQKLDPEYALKVSKNDSYRVQRALEILQSGTKTISEAQRDFATQSSFLKSNFRIQKIALDLDRDYLRKRVGLRTEQMLASHWVEEVKALREKSFGEWAPLKSVGYFEVGEFLDQKISKSELKEKIVTSTMQLAKRQRTWFKRDAENHWIVKAKAAPKEFFEAAKQHLDRALELD